MARRKRRRNRPTPEEIWRLLARTAREVGIARLDHANLLRLLAQLEVERTRRDEARDRRAEEARRQEEARRRQEEARTRRQEEARMQRFREQHEKKMTALRAEREEITAQLEKRLNKMSGYQDNRWGRLLEALVEGGLAKMLRQAGIPIVGVAPRVRASRNDEWREWDLVAYGKSDVVVVEVKTTLNRPHIARFLKRIAEFRQWRPDYAGGALRGGLAFLTTDPETARQVEKAGLYLIRAVGESALIANSEGFEPRLF